jgi:hypothetical protein
MDMYQKKLELVKHILNVDKESVLVKIKEILLNEEEIVVHTVKGEPLTKSQYIRKIEEAKKRIDNGQFTSHDDLLKDVENW